MTTFIPTDPMELLQWVNNMNSGCGNIGVSPGGIPGKGKGPETLGKQINCATQNELDMV